MIRLILYVEELSPDGIKGVTSDTDSVLWNKMVIRQGLMKLALEPLSRGGEINGISVFAAGRYICLLIRASSEKPGGEGMILLDLVGREDIALKMAGKFNNEVLERRFMQVYAEVMRQPECHDLFILKVGKSQLKWVEKQ